MSLPKKFDKRMKQALELHTAWLPGTAIQLGDVLTRDEGIFLPVSNLKEFGVSFRKQVLKERELSLNSQGVSVQVFQGGAKVKVAKIKTGAEANVEVRFKKKNTFFLRTPKLKGFSIDDILAVGLKLRDKQNWRHNRYFIAWKVLNAHPFTFLGSSQKNKTVAFSGKGSAVIKFLQVGLSTGVKKSSGLQLDVEVLGGGGTVAMGIVRIRKNGLPDFI